MTTYRVYLSSMAYVQGTIDIEADSLEEAKEEALRKPRNVPWEYGGELCERPGFGPVVEMVVEDGRPT